MTFPGAAVSCNDGVDRPAKKSADNGPSLAAVVVEGVAAAIAGGMINGLASGIYGGEWLAFDANGSIVGVDAVLAGGVG